MSRYRLYWVESTINQEFTHKNVPVIVDILSTVKVKVELYERVSVAYSKHRHDSDVVHRPDVLCCPLVELL